jgi:hypothetical protein
MVVFGDSHFACQSKPFPLCFRLLTHHLSRHVACDQWGTKSLNPVQSAEPFSHYFFGKFSHHVLSCSVADNRVAYRVLRVFATPHNKYLILDYRLTTTCIYVWPDAHGEAPDFCNIIATR